MLYVLFGGLFVIIGAYMYDKRWNVDTEKLTHREKEIYMSGYNRAIIEMEHMKRDLIQYIRKYVDKDENSSCAL